MYRDEQEETGKCAVKEKKKLPNRRAASLKDEINYYKFITCQKISVWSSVSVNFNICHRF
jgi:hypothetical protein